MTVVAVFMMVGVASCECSFFHHLCILRQAYMRPRLAVREDRTDLQYTSRITQSTDIDCTVHGERSMLWQKVWSGRTDDGGCICVLGHEVGRDLGYHLFGLGYHVEGI